MEELSSTMDRKKQEEMAARLQKVGGWKKHQDRLRLIDDQFALCVMCVAVCFVCVSNLRTLTPRQPTTKQTNKQTKINQGNFTLRDMYQQFEQVNNTNHTPL